MHECVGDTLLNITSYKYFDKSITNKNKIKTHAFVKLHPQRKQSKQINQTGILLPDSANRDESRKWHSCATQLITVIDDWAKIIDNQGQIETYILDFEKALDTPPPPHELLKSKLFSYGIGGKQ